ncbi:MAG TPA: hypothetical protein VMG12_29255 [Polyangiaceae bacterium]|nr:hypothetical protein [Polyangiaceae bacterium]
MHALSPLAAFRAALALLRIRPVAGLALGAALYISLISVCCGFGVVAAPWFSCELLALLLSNGTGETEARHRGWLWAGVYQMASVIVLSSVALVALMALGPAQPLGGAPGLLPAELLQALSVGSVAGVLVLALTAHFEYAPLILIERGGSLSAALLESARVVGISGVLRTFVLSCFAHGLPMLCGVGLIGLLALRATLASSVLFIVLLLPLLVLALVLGQGMLVASYLELRAQVTDPRRVPAGAEPSKVATSVWAGLLVFVALGPLLVSLSLLKPSLPSAVSLDPAAEVLFAAEPAASDQPHDLPGTALSLLVGPRMVRVVASDGGGAGAIPLPRQPVRRVRVAVARPPDSAPLAPPRAESSFAVEIELADGRVLTTFIDEAGVRLDDSWERRLTQRLSKLSGLLLVTCFAWTAAWIARALPPQARIRRRLSGQRPLGHDPEHEQRLRAALRARVIGAALWLLPPALVSLAIGLSALVR